MNWRTQRNGGKVRINEPSNGHRHVPRRRSLGGDSPFQRRVTHERCSLCSIEESLSGKTPLSVRLAHHRKTGLPRRIRVDPTEIADQQSLIEQQKNPSAALGHFFSALSMQKHDDPSRSYPRRTRHCENVISCKKHCTWSRSCI